MEAASQERTYYTIRIREKLNEDWEAWFEEMSVTNDTDGTLLEGYLPDQAALHGVICRIQRLGLHLLAIAERSHDGGSAANQKDRC